MIKPAMLVRLALLLLLASNGVTAAEKASWPSTFFMGWEHSVKGGGFGYHSPEPDVRTSLLVRSEDSTMYIEWETGKVPPTLTSDHVQFVWIFGIDANPDSHSYKLFLNGKYCIKFANPAVSEKKVWTVNGADDVSLTFRTTMLDKYNDPMGYAILSVPSAYIKKGERQIIRISGESAESHTWYMTFEAGVSEKITVAQQEAVIRGEQNIDYFSVIAGFVHLGDPVKATIEQSVGKNTEVTIQPGYNSFRLQFPAKKGLHKDIVKICMDGRIPVIKEITLYPVRPWKIYFVQHAHTDIGYTRPQTEILPEHLRYIDYALDYCDQTDSFPEAAKFRWTCETSWAVNEYLRTRPAAQIERLKRRAAEGRIEITGLYLNSSDLGDETIIAASLQPVNYFRSMGFKVTTAMQDDINGVPWCLVDYLSGAGIGFLNMGQNTDRALKPFDRPTTFWWESPSGKRIIVNRPEHYMWGNNMGIINSREALERNLLTHLGEIAGKGYPFNEYAIQFSGYFTDNSPPSTTACRIVKEWNETYVWPELRLATISEFLDRVKEKHASELPVIHGAWPDWWIDGFGSAALTTAYTRMAHADFIANNGLMAMAVIVGAKLGGHMGDLHQQIFEDLAFYDEHTFGAAESISDPMCENSVVQLGEKLSYTWEAVKKNRILREEIMGCIQDQLPSYKKEASISVVNTLNWNRSGNVNIYIDHQLLPGDRQFRILDVENKEVIAQAWSERAEGSYWTLFADKVPPLGYSSYRIEVSGKPVRHPVLTKFTGTLENPWYVLKIDPVSGKIISLYDKDAYRELVDCNAKYGFGEFIYETLGKNREQISNGHLEEYNMKAWEKIKVSDIMEGPVWTSVTLNGQLPACASDEGIQCEIRLYSTAKKIEFRYSMRKLAVTDPEGVYVSFPFNMKKDNKLFFEVAGATVEAGKDQINGSATDWQGIQNFISLTDDSCGVVFVSPEIPIVQLGDFNLGKFQPLVQKPKPVIYSWVLNNYWTTNFLASQEGELKWTYQVTSGSVVCNDEAARFAWSVRVPMLARVLPASGFENSKATEAGFMGNIPQNLLLIDALPVAGQKGIVYHLRETAGRSASFDPMTLLKTPVPGSAAGKKYLRVALLNVLGEEIRPLTGEMNIAAFETVFIKLAWDEQ
ncbi:MAG: glycosyl hydrolase family 38 [Bacteroidetes bacterium]|nr:glycosyl hydrolase family 38 [Bacteroidota bacterium]